eukprot:1141174-Pelagomonas_calceolata.AAC.3
MPKKKHGQNQQQQQQQPAQNNAREVAAPSTVDSTAQQGNTVDEVQCAKLAVWATAAVKDYTTGKRCVLTEEMSAGIAQCDSCCRRTAGVLLLHFCSTL